MELAKTYRAIVFLLRTTISSGSNSRSTSAPIMERLLRTDRHLLNDVVMIFSYSLKVYLDRFLVS